MSKSCNNCAWFCHADGKCYGNSIRVELATTTTTDNYCRDWAFDGLEDWERTDCETLMTMEPEAVC